MSKKYIEILYRPDENYPNKPWVVDMGNLPKQKNGKKYIIYVEEVDDNDEREEDTDARN